MIVRKRFQIGRNISLIYVCSDADRKIRLEGSDELADEVVYPAEEDRTYVETNIPVDALKDEAPEVVEIIFGGYVSAERAGELAEVIRDMAGNLDDTSAIGAPELFPQWDGAGVDYIKGDRVRYRGLLYRVLQPHTSQADWTPDAAVSLFVRIDDPADEWPEWRQPAGAHDAYAKGAKVSYSGRHWISSADANVWMPGVYGWAESTEG